MGRERALQDARNRKVLELLNNKVRRPVKKGIALFMFAKRLAAAGAHLKRKQQAGHVPVTCVLLACMVLASGQALLLET